MIHKDLKTSHNFSGNKREKYRYFYYMSESKCPFNLPFCVGFD